ncbi:hypothetical protein PVK06_047650 [Gossypium arboreum]|uniref:Uncharacterized protein n=1 Tax=Gossypium arboreum TaxID=29729 RepID=A0ABR0ME62_GOSAR|nr:hypothetical protein PVK06_047650 [Gossypium arboreum]
MLSLLTEVKFNILLYTQVATGPFDARHIDFDALYEIEMDNLGFDGGLGETSVVVTSNIATEFVVENTKAV